MFLKKLKRFKIILVLFKTLSIIKPNEIFCFPTFAEKIYFFIFFAKKSVSFLFRKKRFQ